MHSVLTEGMSFGVILQGISEFLDGVKAAVLKVDSHASVDRSVMHSKLRRMYLHKRNKLPVSQRISCKSCIVVFRRAVKILPLSWMYVEAKASFLHAKAACSSNESICWASKERMLSYLNIGLHALDDSVC